MYILAILSFEPIFSFKLFLNNVEFKIVKKNTIKYHETFQNE